MPIDFRRHYTPGKLLLEEERIELQLTIQFFLLREIMLILIMLLDIS